MERCTLCGGKLRPDGRCAECGLDNSRNDKKYHLNTHNDKTSAFHRGKCEDHLNRDREERNSGERKNSGKSGQTDSKKAVGNNSRNESQGAGAARGKRPDSSQGAGAARKETENYSSGKATARQRKQTGTVKKKRSSLGTVVKAILLIYVLNFLFTYLPEAVNEIMDEISERQEAVSYDEAAEVRDPETDDADEEPEIEELQHAWDTQADGYYTAMLTPGVYTVGYDIPAGTYQISCPKGTGWVTLCDQEAEITYFEALYSAQEQKNYEEYMETACPHSEYTELLTLDEGMVLWLEECQYEFLLAGIGDGADSLKEHEPQQLSRTVKLQDSMTAGTDFEQGVYDLVLDGEDTAVCVNINIEETDTPYYIYLDENGGLFQRFPFSRGTTVEADFYGASGEVLLVPSY